MINVLKPRKEAFPGTFTPRANRPENPAFSLNGKIVRLNNILAILFSPVAPLPFKMVKEGFTKKAKK